MQCNYMVALAQILRNKRTGRVLITLPDNFGYELSAPMGYITIVSNEIQPNGTGL